MKRYICIFFTLMIFLSGCTETVQKENGEKQIRSVFYIDGELPDIGDFSGSKKQEHFHGEYTPYFIPCDSYGEIIPYIGNYKIYKTTDADWLAEQGYASYGLCTPDGRIVMDASEKNYHVNYFETDDGFGYYTVSRNLRAKNDAPDEYYPGETLLIPKDGKWCKTLDSSTWLSSAGSGVIIIGMYIDDNQYKTVVCDYNGAELFSKIGVMPLGIPSNDLILLIKWAGGLTPEHYFVNKDGEKVLGPYKYAASFSSEGTAYVCDYDDNYYFIDTSGKRLTFEDYSEVTECIREDGNHWYIARHKNYIHRGNDVLDSFGNIIANIENSSYITLRFPKNGEILYRDSGGVWKRLSDRTVFKSREFNVSPNEYYGTDDLYFYRNEEDGSAVVFDGNGETVAIFDSFFDFTDISENGKYVAYNSGTCDYKYDEILGKSITTDTRKLHIYDTEKQEHIYSSGLPGYANFTGEDDRYIFITTYQSDYFAGTSIVSLYDTKTDKIIFDSCNTIRQYIIGGKSYFCVCTKNTNTLYDSDMNVIIRTYTE